MNWNYAIGVYSFTLGCAFFTLDSFYSKPVRIKYIVGCVLFDIGCAFFIVDVHNPK